MKNTKRRTILTLLAVWFVISFGTSFLPRTNEMPREPVDVSQAQELGREGFARYMALSGITSYRILQTKLALRAGNPDAALYSVTAEQTTAESKVGITWSALVRKDESGNWTIIEEGPHLDPMLLPSQGL